MKKCEYDGCPIEIDDKYKRCYEHYKTGAATDMASKPTSGKWNDDPTTDAFLKMNSNLGNIGRGLERLNTTLSMIEGHLEKIAQALAMEKK